MSKSNKIIFKWWVMLIIGCSCWGWVMTEIFSDSFWLGLTLSFIGGCMIGGISAVGKKKELDKLGKM